LGACSLKEDSIRERGETSGFGKSHSRITILGRWVRACMRSLGALTNPERYSESHLVIHSSADARGSRPRPATQTKGKKATENE
jgi:hypothetical protein